MSLVNFLFKLLIILCLLFTFAYMLVVWVLRRIMKASVRYKISGWRCLRDVTILFEKGAVEAVSVGEIRFSFSRSLVKLQLLISNIKIVIRPSNDFRNDTRSQKPHQSHSSPGSGKWMVVANIARFLSISVTDFVVKTPKATVEVKDFGIEISKDGGTKSSILVKLRLFPFVVHLGEPRISFDRSSNFFNGETFPTIEKGFAPFICEKFYFSCKFGHDREAGIVVKNVDISIGEVDLNLNEELIPRMKPSDNQVDPVLQSSTEYNNNQNKQASLLSIIEYTSFIPEKVCLTLPKLNVRFVHKEHCTFMENNIIDIHLKSEKSLFVNDIEESTRFDLELYFSEIHLLKEAEDSMVDIYKLSSKSSVYIPIQHASPIRSESKINLGGTHCNLFMERLKTLIKLMSSNKKKMVLRDENINPVTMQSGGAKVILWTYTISAPDMTIVLFNLSGFPIYHVGCTQSSIVFANNISSKGTAVHLKLEEMNLHMADEYQESLRETLFSVETNTGSLLHIAKISLDWGENEDSPLDDSSKFILVLSVDITSMGVNLTFKRVQSLLSTAFMFITLLKAPSPSIKSQTWVGRSTKPSVREIQLIKFNLERCSVNLVSDVGFENEVIEDPIHVNYGSQGGRVTYSALPDGTLRTAIIQSSVSDMHKTVTSIVTLHFHHFSFCSNKKKQSTQLELESATSVYQEYLQDINNSGIKLTLFDLQNAKIMRRSGGNKEIAVCSLFSATDITVRWEPDVHLALLDLGLRMKLLYAYQKDICSSTDKDNELIKSGRIEENRKNESVFAIDIETLTVRAEAGDGVEAEIEIQSIFSENARIGVLLEGLILSFNGGRVFKSGRMQISRMPNDKTESDGKWNWLIQSSDIHIRLPYRFPVCSVHDSIEEMLRALKLVTVSKTRLIFPFKESGAKPKTPTSSKIVCVMFSIRKLTADVEEEPMQGWLDEHYRIMKNEARELAVRMALLDSITAKLNQSPVVDLQDSSSVEKLKEEIYKQSFRSYYRACQTLKTAEGSGSFQDGFQSGFQLSTSRTSLFSVTLKDLSLSLSAVKGGEAAMIEFVQNLDPVALENKIPFSCLHGCNLELQTGSLVVQLRDYTYPLLAGTSAKCEGRVVLAQQATPFQPQVLHDVYIGRWRKVQMYRSVSGTTPPMKTYWDFPIDFKKGEISYGVGFEPAFADLSYAFIVALRRANLSVRNPNASNIDIEPPQKENVKLIILLSPTSLPWWDEMRNSIHGKAKLCFTESTFNILATTDPYEQSDKLLIASGYLELKHSDGRINVSAKDLKMFSSGLDILLQNSTIKPPAGICDAFLLVPSFILEVTMVWECESGNPLNHYLFALPSEGVIREKIYDSFRSTSLSLRWNVSLRPISSHSQSSSNDSTISPTLNVGPHDLAWLIKFLNLNYIPPHKLRYFSQWPRFGVARVPTSGNLSLGEVLTELMFLFDSTPTVLRHISLVDNDPAKGLTCMMTKLKFEMCYSRGKQKYTFQSKRDILDLVYESLDLHTPKIFLNKDDYTSLITDVQTTRKNSKSATAKRFSWGTTERHDDDGFLLSSDCFTIRRQSPKADPARLLAWLEAGRMTAEMTNVSSEFENGSESDEGYNVVIADNCRRIFVYGLKMLWTIENRDVVWWWFCQLSKMYSSSRQYAQRKLLNKKESLQEDVSRNPSIAQGAESSSKQKEALSAINKHEFDDSDQEGTRHMLHVIEPQFNFHSEEANGRFLLTAVSGRVLYRSFHAFVEAGIEMIKQPLRSDWNQPEVIWNRMEISVILEHVQAHVAPTDVSSGAGLQWLPKIHRNAPRVKFTDLLIEQVFMPCDMYFRYTLHNGGTTDLKVKPLKEVTFHSQNITATMTSRQFQVVLDVLTNLLFARLPKPRRSNLSISAEYFDVIEEEAYDEVVPDGIKEVDLERVNLEQKERAQNLLFDDIRKLSVFSDTHGDAYLEKEGNFLMITGGRSTLVHGLRKELVYAQKARNIAAVSLRMAIQKAEQLRLLEKEKNKIPSYAMRVSLQINKAVWVMLVDGKSVAEAEINDMIFDFDRDFKDVGLVRFSTKFFVLRNCLPNAKSDMLLSAWNPPLEWEKKVMLRVDAKLGAPKDGNSPIELLQVDIYPLKIHLTEKMYRMMWEYIFPEEEQDSLRRQEVWKVSTTAGVRRGNKGSMVNKASASGSHSKEELKGFFGSNPSVRPSTSRTNHLSTHADSIHKSDGVIWDSTAQELDRTLNLALLKMESVRMVKQQDESSKTAKNRRSSQEEKKLDKRNDDKTSRSKGMREIHNIKISQVELLVTYEASVYAVKDLKLLMDTFHLVEFTGTWQRLFSKVKKHISWGFLKSVTGFQGKKFKKRLHDQGKETTVYGNITAADLNLSDSDDDPTGNNMDRVPITWPKRPPKGAGDGFVTSVRGLFNSQRRKAKNEVQNDQMVDDDWSESDTEDSPFARKLIITKAKKLIRRHTEKSHAKRDVQPQQRDSSLSLPPIEETEPFESDSSSESKPYEDFLEYMATQENLPQQRDSSLSLPPIEETEPFESDSSSESEPSEDFLEYMATQENLPQQRDSSLSLPPIEETEPFESDSSSESEPYEDFP